MNDGNNFSIFPEFKTHRHNQSVINILLYLNTNLKIYYIDDNSIYSNDSITPHYYQHPPKGIFLFIKYLPLDFVKFLDPFRKFIKKIRVFFSN